MLQLMPYISCWSKELKKLNNSRAEKLSSEPINKMYLPLKLHAFI